MHLVHISCVSTHISSPAHKKLYSETSIVLVTLEVPTGKYV